MIIKPKFKLIKNTREGYDKKEISISKNFKNCELNITVAEILIKYVISNRDNPVITYKELALKISQESLLPHRRCGSKSVLPISQILFRF